MKRPSSLRFLFSRFAAGIVCPVLAILWAGCASGPERRQMSAGFRESAPDSSVAGRSRALPEKRPGLGTGWGEERESRVGRGDFVRADGNRPAAVDRIYYNDREGIETMLDAAGGSRRKVRGLTPMVGGLVRAGLRGGRGGWLDSVSAGGQLFVAGERGERYEIVVGNSEREPLEVVLSVDGLDVMDGRSASFSKRGYIVQPGGTLNVEGFRTGSRTVAAFRFSTVSRSYAALRHGDTRNVGVIGIAVFRDERYARDWRETSRRQGADPFPNARWAEAPR